MMVNSLLILFKSAKIFTECERAADSNDMLSKSDKELVDRYGSFVQSTFETCLKHVSTFQKRKIFCSPKHTLVTLQIILELRLNVPPFWL